MTMEQERAANDRVAKIKQHVRDRGRSIGVRDREIQRVAPQSRLRDAVDVLSDEVQLMNVERVNFAGRIAQRPALHGSGLCNEHRRSGEGEGKSIKIEAVIV